MASSPVVGSVASEIASGMRRQLARVSERAGWKVAFNVPAVQRRLGIDGWLIGAIPRAGVREPGRAYPVAPSSKTKLEAEIGVCLRSDLTVDSSDAKVRSAVEVVAPAIEIVDFSLPSASLEEMVAYSFFHAGAVFGVGKGTFTPLGDDFPRVVRNGETVAGPSSAVPPFDLVGTLQRAAKLLAEHDEGLRAGDWILCGSLIDPVPMRPGDHFAIDYGPLGRLELGAVARS